MQTYSLARLIERPPTWFLRETGHELYDTHEYFGDEAERWRVFWRAVAAERPLIEFNRYHDLYDAYALTSDGIYIHASYSTAPDHFRNTIRGVGTAWVWGYGTTQAELRRQIEIAPIAVLCANDGSELILRRDRRYRIFGISQRLRVPKARASPVAKKKAAQRKAA